MVDSVGGATGIGRDGWTVPGYTEVRSLGEGGFGQVYLATQDTTGTPVAIKYLHPDLLSDPDHVAMFRAEARTLSGLDNQYIARLYEYVEGPQGAAIVMEAVEGASLARILESYGQTTPEAALVVLFGSLLGLGAAHARGVVHRDYKPANVLVTAQGVSKLTDFGIAVLAGDLPLAAGTPNYMPPEQFTGAAASPAGDVYAATVTFYQCLTGHLPFNGRSQTELFEQHRGAPVPMGDVPQALQPIVARGMAKDPRYRPSDATSLAAELRAAAVGGYGADWEERGRSHLREAALLLLLLLWPDGKAPAAQGTSVEEVQLIEAAPVTRLASAAKVTAAAPAEPIAARLSREARHRWHELHVHHLEHLAHLRAEYRESDTREQPTRQRRLQRAVRLHPFTAVGAAAALVIVAIVAVASSGGSGGPSPSGQSGPGGSAALAGAGATNPGGGSGNSYGKCEYYEDTLYEGTSTLPVTAASVATSFQREIAACTGAVVPITCGQPDYEGTFEIIYQCAVPFNDVSQSGLALTENSLFVTLANGHWVNED
jgi:hypothetical protein